MPPHPIRLALGGDLRRNRLTVFFRLLLAIPHIIWLALWTIAAFFAAIANWIATLVLGRSPAPLHRFLGAYVRYATHVFAYLFLAASPFPEFTGTPGDYPIDLEVDPPQPQRRWVTAFRLILALPALLITAALGGGFAAGGGGRTAEGGESYGSAGFAGLAGTIAFLAWFACLVRGPMPLGFRNALVVALRYSAQTWGYLLCLTDRYPNADPTLPAFAGEPPPRPVRVVDADDLTRSRLTVFFRLLLALPHLIWLTLWGIVAFFAAIVGWFATLFTGRLPSTLHRFLSAFVRYDVHVTSFLMLVANPFPGFVGREGSYPVDVAVDPPERQPRPVTGFRLLLAIPAFIVNSALGTLLFVAAFLGWFASLALGRMPAGLRGLGLWAVRYSAEAYGYILLLTSRYPYSGAPTEPEPGPELEPVAAPAA